MGSVPGREEGHPPGGQSCLGWDSSAGLMTHRTSSHSWGFLDDKFAEGPQSSAGTFPGAHRSFLAVALGLPAKPKAPPGLFLPHPYPSLGWVLADHHPPPQRLHPLSFKRKTRQLRTWADCQGSPLREVPGRSSEVSLDSKHRRHHLSPSPFSISWRPPCGAQLLL